MRKKIPVVSIIGPPNGGKTILIEWLARELKEVGYKNILSIQDQIRNTPITGSEISKNLWAIREIANLITEARGKSLDLIMIERGGASIFASVETFLNLNGIKTKDEEQEAEITKALALDVLNRYETFFILVNIDPEVSIARDERMGKTTPGEIINSKFLTELEKTYKKMWDEKILPRHRTKVVNGNLDVIADEEKVKKYRVRVLNSLISLVEKEGKT